MTAHAVGMRLDVSVDRRLSTADLRPTMDAWEVAV
jgi:hypothetical protein